MINSTLRPWYKTPGGIAFLSILGLIGFVILIFASLVGYYLWQIKFGHSEKLEQKFNPQFTVNHQLADKVSNATTTDIVSVIKPEDPSIGEAGALITILAFTDFTCQYSRSALPAFLSATKNYEPVVRIVYKMISLDATGDSWHAALATACANEQGQFLSYYEQLFSTQDLSATALTNLASKLGLNQAQFESCLTSEKYKDYLLNNYQDAGKLGLRGTPTFFVNDKRVEGVIGREEWDEVILGEMKK
jgi:protein-disulfide isomerase